ncbi:TfoX/Sxy family protein [Christensenella hongkongensis]|uniref:TfoX/Sxy family protein n=1 Tax=Christensenella hongkongensis TaxID=270498 RepID=UPI002671EE0D|nr:TfoX/Sxy family protein [Christensenella hongkongensis]
MGELSKLPNIGPVVEEQLHQAGIKTAEELRKTGSRDAWLKIKAIDPSACYNMLCGLEGALRGIRWHNLPDETKKELKDFYNSFK